MSSTYQHIEGVPQRIDRFEYWGSHSRLNGIASGYSLTVRLHREPDTSGFYTTLSKEDATLYYGVLFQFREKFKEFDVNTYANTTFVVNLHRRYTQAQLASLMRDTIVLAKLSS